ncbi:MAG: YunG family protein [Acidimicrobiia bacterium]
MDDRAQLVDAIRRSWSAETSGTPEEWSAAVPAKGQCDASSFVAWEYLGGDLVLGQVFVDGVQTEHHYWNRINGEDLDLTREQFMGEEDIREIAVLGSEQIRTQQGSLKPDVASRIDVMRSLVRERMGATDSG